MAKSRTNSRNDPLGWLDHPDRVGGESRSAEWFSSRLRVLARDECIQLLHSHQFGRIAFSDKLGPDLLPMNYIMDGDDLLIATTSYGALAAGVVGERVAFEIDGTDEDTRTGWSVVVRGRVSRESPFDLPAERPRPWVNGTRTCVLRIGGDLITGRRLIAT